MFNTRDFPKEAILVTTNPSTNNPGTPVTPKSKPRRGVVERTLGWLSKCRALPIRYDKNGFNHLGLIQLACALL